MSKPTTGRILHYSIAPGDLPDDLRIGQVRPALVITVSEDDKCSVIVFLNGAYDIQSLEGFTTLWRESVEILEEPTLGKLNWPPRS